jgi:hypothetical protein
MRCSAAAHLHPCSDGNQTEYANEDADLRYAAGGHTCFHFSLPLAAGLEH